jgi:hypothetical protein
MSPQSLLLLPEPRPLSACPDPRPSPGRQGRFSAFCHASFSGSLSLSADVKNRVSGEFAMIPPSNCGLSSLKVRPLAPAVCESCKVTSWNGDGAGFRMHTLANRFSLSAHVGAPGEQSPGTPGPLQPSIEGSARRSVLSCRSLELRAGSLRDAAD